MVLNGHFPGEGHRTVTNDAGQPVFEMVADYQSRANGGDGFLRLIEFNPAAGRVDVKTYSFGIQASKAFPVLSPYGGIAYETFEMTTEYTTDTGAGEEQVHIELETEKQFHVTGGGTLNLGVFRANAALEFAKHFGVTAGVGVGAEGWPLPVAIDSTSVFTSPACWYRRAGSFSSARSTTSSRRTSNCTFFDGNANLPSGSSPVSIS